MLDNGQEGAPGGGQWAPYSLGRRDVPPEIMKKCERERDRERETERERCVFDFKDGSSWFHCNNASCSPCLPSNIVFTVLSGFHLVWECSIMLEVLTI